MTAQPSAPARAVRSRRLHVLAGSACIMMACVAAATSWFLVGGAPGDAAWPGVTRQDCAVAGNIPDMRCGYIEVLENRAVAGGKAIRIAVAVFLPDHRAGWFAEPPLPLVFLSGGPGSATGLDADGLTWWVERRRDVPWMRDRPLILVDFRGTGLSSPLPMCPEISVADADNFLWNPDDYAMTAAWRAAAAQCKARLREHGADIAAYDTTADALDLVAVRRALGLAQWDVWGVSYGTRVAFELMRHDPAGIRSVVMEAAVPPEAAVFGGGAAALDMVVTRMRDDCLADPECADHFGDIRESVAAVAARLHDQPLPARFHGDDGIKRDLVVTKEMFLRTVAINFYDMEYVVDVPMMVDATLHGDYWLLSEFITSFAGGLKYDDGSNNALLLSHLCRDEFPFEPMAALRHPPAAPPFDGTRPPLRELVLCPDWAGAANATVNMPVESDLPVLFLSGAYDVATPTAWSRAAMMHLPNAYLVEFPDAAHGVLPDDPCGIDLVGAFLKNPSADPRSGLDCLMPTPAFNLMP